ncbi:HAD-IIB family hydrolase [Chlamydia sp. 17-3921]|uniref:HAD-IIB family hydrolase n=1 Tax=Chlamydia sp. 17-3921 TaxID=2675798 RepID=UPI001919712A|nr:HAD family hydrolase [Chlamydia sp. 17-3921]
MKKLLVTDIDGTITDKAHRLDPDVIDTLISLSKSDWSLFFLTGRYFSYASPLFKKFPVPYLLGCQNGASVWSSISQTFVYSQNLNRDLLAVLQESVADCPVTLSIESGASHNDHYYRYSPTLESKFLYKMLDPVYFPTSNERSILVETENLEKEYPFPSFAAAKIIGERCVVEEIQKKLIQNKDFISKVNLALMRWPFDFNYSILFFTDKNVSKGHALDRVIEIFYNGEKPFVMASGDDNNDIGLILRGDFRIVMKSAPEELHGIADFLAPPAEENGILSAWEAGVNYFKGLMNV